MTVQRFDPILYNQIKKEEERQPYSNHEEKKIENAISESYDKKVPYETSIFNINHIVQINTSKNNKVDIVLSNGSQYDVRINSKFLKSKIKRAGGILI